MLDSGSVSTACPYAWCSDISVNDEEKVYLQDIQQSRIPSHGSRVVPLELWVSLGKMIESGFSFTFSFDENKCYMHKDNKRVEIFRKGRIFVLKMTRRWLKSTLTWLRPSTEVADEEMVVDVAALEVLKVSSRVLLVLHPRTRLVPCMRLAGLGPHSGSELGADLNPWTPAAYAMMMEKEQQMQGRDHVQMSQEMIHHHHDHERYD